MALFFALFGSVAKGRRWRMLRITEWMKRKHGRKTNTWRALNAAFVAVLPVAPSSRPSRHPREAEKSRDRARPGGSHSRHRPSRHTGTTSPHSILPWTLLGSFSLSSLRYQLGNCTVTSMTRGSSERLGMPACQRRKSRMTSDPLGRLGWMGGRCLRRCRSARWCVGPASCRASRARSVRCAPRCRTAALLVCLSVCGREETTP